MFLFSFPHVGSILWRSPRVFYLVLIFLFFFRRRPASLTLLFRIRDLAGALLEAFFSFTFPFFLFAYNFPAASRSTCQPLLPKDG